MVSSSYEDLHFLVYSLFLKKSNAVTNQAKVGIFAFVTIVIFVLGFYFLKGINLFSTKSKYFAVYDRVDGLYKSNQVTINGYKIGIVSDMSIDQKTGKVIIQIMAENDYPIPSNSIAEIQSTDLVGGKQVGIVLGDSKDILKSGDTLQTGFKKDFTSTISAAIDPLMAKISHTLAGLDTVLHSVAIALNKNDPKSTIGSLNASLANIEAITHDIEASGSLNKSLKNIESITTNINNNNANIDKLLKNLGTFSDNLKDTDLKTTVNNAKEAIAALQLILNKINKGEGTVGKLVKDEQVYQHLDSAIVNLDKLLVDVKAHPYRYVNVSVFGGEKRDAKYKEKLAKKEAATKAKAAK